MEPLPSDLARARPPRQPFPPEPHRPEDNAAEASIVATDAKVGEVPLQHPAESLMLLGQRPRPHIAAALVNGLERARQTILGGTLPHRRIAPPRLAPYVEKAEKDKRPRQRRFCSGALSRWPKVNQPGLLRVQFQPELRQPLA